MRIEVICTGDEVLTGKIVNTNFSYITQKLEDVGLAVQWETTVGDDRENLLLAFKLAGERADAVIVNGGLGPTVDDLSQEIAAQAAGVELVLNEGWLKTMEEFFRRRSRVMPPNNKKQAMLPSTAEVIDNPIGTACGFTLDIGRARFFFTPGVPRELRRMLEEQIIPRLLARSGLQTAIFLKRFHSYGLGESHVDSLLEGVGSADWSPDGKYIVFASVSRKTANDIWIFSLASRKAEPWLERPQDEAGARIAPNGRWIAYTSGESGRDEVYVQAFPAKGEARWQVSTGGVAPSWRADGKELFYISLDNTMMSVQVQTDGTFSAASPVALFKMRLHPSFGSTYDVSPDGQRFIANSLKETDRSDQSVTIVLNWPSSLKK